MTETPDESIDAVLRSDHAAIIAKIDQLRASTDADASGELFEQLSADIVRHDVAEEQYLLPAVREHLPDGESISAASFEEHKKLEGLLCDLDHDDTTDERLGEVFDRLTAAVTAHARAQESDVLPALVAACDETKLNELGNEVLGSEQLAPTHPRSFVPKSATLSKVTSWLTGLVEKSWDSRDAD